MTVSLSRILFCIFYWTSVGYLCISESLRFDSDWSKLSDLSGSRLLSFSLSSTNSVPSLFKSSEFSLVPILLFVSRILFSSSLSISSLISMSLSDE